MAVKCAAADHSSQAALQVTTMQGMVETADIAHTHASLAASSSQHAALSALPSSSSVSGPWSQPPAATPLQAGCVWANMATTLVESLLHEVWYVRHGAALCLGPLLQWALAPTPPTPPSLGPGPGRLLARLLLLLSHERFGDYSEGVLVAPVLQAACACLVPLAQACQPEVAADALAVLTAVAAGSQWISRYAAAQGMLSLLPLLGSAACAHVAGGLLRDAVDEVRCAALQCLLGGESSDLRGDQGVPMHAPIEHIQDIIQGVLCSDDLSSFPGFALGALTQCVGAVSGLPPLPPSQLNDIALLGCVLLQHNSQAIQAGAAVLLAQLLSAGGGLPSHVLHCCVRSACRCLLLLPPSQPAAGPIHVLLAAVAALGCHDCSICAAVLSGLGEVACTAQGDCLNHWLLRESLLQDGTQSSTLKAGHFAPQGDANADFAAGGDDWALGDLGLDGDLDEGLDEYILHSDTAEGITPRCDGQSAKEITEDDLMSRLGAFEARLLRGRPPQDVAGVGSAAIALLLRRALHPDSATRPALPVQPSSAASVCAVALDDLLSVLCSVEAEVSTARDARRLHALQGHIEELLSEALPDSSTESTQCEALDCWSTQQALADVLSQLPPAPIGPPPAPPVPVEWDQVIEVQPLLLHARTTAEMYCAAVFGCVRTSPAAGRHVHRFLGALFPDCAQATMQGIQEATRNATLQQLQQLAAASPADMCRAPQADAAAADASSDDDSSSEEEETAGVDTALALIQERDRLHSHTQGAIAELQQRAHALRCKARGLAAAARLARTGDASQLQELAACLPHVDAAAWHWCVCMALRCCSVPGAALPPSARAGAAKQALQLGGQDSAEERCLVLSAALRACVTLSSCCVHLDALLGRIAWAAGGEPLPAVTAVASSLQAYTCSTQGDEAQGTRHTFNTAAVALRGVLMSNPRPWAMCLAGHSTGGPPHLRAALYAALTSGGEEAAELRLMVLHQAQVDAGSTAVLARTSVAARRLLFTASCDKHPQDAPNEAPELQAQLHAAKEALQYMQLGSSAAALEGLPPLQWQPACGLRVYQRHGVAWLVHLWRCGFGGGLLADEMGLGKTVQCLSALAASVVLQAQAPPPDAPGRVLVVAPSAVCLHWKREIQQQFGACKLGKRSMFGVVSLQDFLGDDEGKGEAGGGSPAPSSAQGGGQIDPPVLQVCITSYHKLRQMSARLAPLVLYGLVLDEAHLAVNPRSATFQAAAGLRAGRRVLLTGTPIQNRVLDMWALFHLAVPGMLGPRIEFQRRYERPANKARRQLSGGATQLAAKECATALKQLHARTQPFMLRRTKAQVLPQLPPKLVRDVPCALVPRQQQLYAAWEQTQHTEAHTEDAVDLLKLQPGCTDPLPATALRRLANLLAICNHPDLVEPPGSRSARGGATRRTRTQRTSQAAESGKMLACIQLLGEVWQLGDGSPEDAAPVGDTPTPSPKRSRRTPRWASAVQSPTDTNDAEAAPGAAGGMAGQLALARAQAGQLALALSADVAQAGRLLAATPTAADVEMGAADMPIDHVSHAVELEAGSAAPQAPGAVLVFAQRHSALRLLHECVLQTHYPQVPCFWMHGGMSAKAREESVDAFRGARGARVMLLTTSVGGLGLNLQVAQDVVFLDHSWNPQADIQAQDRAHRLGQRAPVRVHRLLAADTVEERLMGVQRFKLGLAQSLVAAADPGNTHHAEAASGFLGSF